MLHARAHTAPSVMVQRPVRSNRPARARAQGRHTRAPRRGPLHTSGRAPAPTLTRAAWPTGSGPNANIRRKTSFDLPRRHEPVRSIVRRRLDGRSRRSVAPRAAIGDSFARDLGGANCGAARVPAEAWYLYVPCNRANRRCARYRTFAPKPLPLAGDVEVSQLGISRQFLGGHNEILYCWYLRGLA